MFSKLKYIYELHEKYGLSEIHACVHPNDDMLFAGGMEHYLSEGKGALEIIIAACMVSKLEQVKTVLDLPCGYGRVLRHVVKFFSEADVFACDLNEEAVKFCADNFGVKTMMSKAELTKVQFDALFDVIWVGSLFTHTSQETTMRWMKHLVKYLTPNGVVVATTLGRNTEQIRSGRFINMDYWQKIYSDYCQFGAGYHDYSKNEWPYSFVPGSYGISIAKPSITIRDIEEIPGVRVFLYQERMWGGLQDVVVFGRPGYDE